MNFSTLESVNKEFNALPYESEVGDDWTPIDLTEDKEDDCDSYATAKAEKLIKLGWSKKSLRLAFCQTETKEYHLVLLVDFEGQTYCLDNRYPYPMRVQDLNYVWLRFWHLDTGKWEFAQAS